MEAKHYDNAIEDYDEAIQLDPKYATPYNNRGMGGNPKAISTMRSRTMIRRSASIPILPPLTQTVVLRGSENEILTEPSPTATKRSSSTRTIPFHTSVAALRGDPKATPTAQ